MVDKVENAKDFGFNFLFRLLYWHIYWSKLRYRSPKIFYKSHMWVIHATVLAADTRLCFHGDVIVTTQVVSDDVTLGL